MFEQGISTRKRCHRADGVTFIELVVVVAIIAMLAAFAYPSYTKQTMKSRRTAAIGALKDAASRQEQFFLNNKTYTDKFDATGINMATTTEDDFYTLAVEAPTGSCPLAGCYVLKADPQGAQSGDSCGTLKLTSTGKKTPANCW